MTEKEVIVIDKVALRDAIRRMGEEYLDEYGWEHVQAASMNHYLQAELPKALFETVEENAEKGDTAGN